MDAPVLKERNRLGLPKAITNTWRKRGDRISPETGHTVSPAFIPAHDQVVAYAAQVRTSFDHSFRKHLHAILAEQAPIALARMGRVASLVWKSYAFLAPGGAHYDPKRTVEAQSGRPFGVRTALHFLAHSAQTRRGTGWNLNEILTTPELNSVQWVRSAKTRAAEALFLERLWTVTRDLLVPDIF